MQLTLQQNKKLLLFLALFLTNQTWADIVFGDANGNSEAQVADPASVSGSVGVGANTNTNENNIIDNPNNQVQIGNSQESVNLEALEDNLRSQSGGAAEDVSKKTVEAGVGFGVGVGVGDSGKADHVPRQPGVAKMYFNEVIPDGQYTEKEKMQFVNDFIGEYYHDSPQEENGPYQDEIVPVEDPESNDGQYKSPENESTPEENEGLSEEGSNVPSETVDGEQETLKEEVVESEPLETDDSSYYYYVDSDSENGMAKPSETSFGSNYDKDLAAGNLIIDKSGQAVPVESLDCDPQNPDDLIEPAGYNYSQIEVNFINDTALEKSETVYEASSYYPQHYIPSKREDSEDKQAAQDEHSSKDGDHANENNYDDEDVNNTDKKDESIENENHEENKTENKEEEHKVKEEDKVEEEKKGKGKEAQAEHEKQHSFLHNEFATYQSENGPAKKKQRTKKEKEEEAKKALKSDNPKKSKKTSKNSNKKTADDNKQLKSDIKIINGISKKPINTNRNLAVEKKIKQEEKKLQKEKAIPDQLVPYVLRDEDNFVSGLKNLSEQSREEWKNFVYYDSKDECIDWDDWEEHDTYEGDCDKLDQIKKYIAELFKKLHKEKREAIAEIINILCHINEGKHRGIRFLVELVAILGEEAFLVLKSILVLIHRLIEAGLDGFKLVLDAIIELECHVLQQFEDDCFCDCDCPKKKGRILNHVQMLFFWHHYPSTTWKSEEIVAHLKELFKIDENPSNCWCDCFCDDRKNNFWQAYSIQDIDLAESPYMATTLANAFSNANNTEAVSIAANPQRTFKKMNKRKRQRKSRTGKTKRDRFSSVSQKTGSEKQQYLSQHYNHSTYSQNGFNDTARSSLSEWPSLGSKLFASDTFCALTVALSCLLSVVSFI